MVKLNNLLTLLCASSLYSVVAGYQGECLDLQNTIKEKHSIGSCYTDENGKMIYLNIPSNGEVLTQNDIDIISNYSNLEELNLVRFNDMSGVNFESLHLQKLKFLDLSNNMHNSAKRFRNNTFPAKVLQTIKNIDTIELDGYIITQNTLNDLGTLTNVKEMYLTDSGFDKNLDFSVLKNAKSLTTLILKNYYNAQPLNTLSESICKIKQLKRLDIFSKIRSLPSCINNLKKLEYLDLYGNNIKELPSEIGGLTKLKYLDLHFNSINKFNSALCKLTKLEILKMNDNDISKIPSCIQDLSKLKDLDLSYNSIEAIPSSLYNLKKLENLNLGNNYIQKLSSSIKNLKYLKDLTLHNNKIVVIPDNIGKLSNLISLNLIENGISKIPENIGKLVKLEQLYLNGNSITEIPESIGKLTNLKIINLNQNKISVIPKALGKLSNLEELYLDYNLITDLPKFLGNLTNLSELHLRSNKIDATIPESYNNLKKLTRIDLDGNVDIRGKTLTNPLLGACLYNIGGNKTKNGICVVENANCVPFMTSTEKLQKCQ